MIIKRSPFFYVGDKYKLMPQLQTLFPKNINTYYEPFCGGGSSFLNTSANQYIVNDIDEFIIKLHLYFASYKGTEFEFKEELLDIVKKYGLSCSMAGINVTDELKKKYVKTYYAKYNKNAYINLRSDYNLDKSNIKLLYLLLIYGFNHMIRFNSKGDFNLPVGNVDFNKNVDQAINGYFEFTRTHNIRFYCSDYKDFIKKQTFNNNDFIFCDPPYLISQSEYNKLWCENEEQKLYTMLDELNEQGITFGLTNLLIHKGQTNNILKEWMSKYQCYDISSNYISFHDNTIKKNSKEVYVTNG